MESYDSNEESVYIIYLDTNNLYGWGMIQYLPYGGFNNFCLNSISFSLIYFIGYIWIYFRS